MRAESYWKSHARLHFVTGTFSSSLSLRPACWGDDDAFYWIHLVCAPLDLLVFLQAIELTEQTFFAAETNGGGTYFHEFDLHLFWNSLSSHTHCQCYIKLRDI